MSTRSVDLNNIAHESARELTPVERRHLEASGRRLLYAPRERIPVIEVNGFPALGKLVALRFLEWSLAHPEGVVALPTGKTPETFIAWTRHYLESWTEPETREQLEHFGFESPTPPDLSGLRFVQIDEFYPIDVRQENSFYHYIHRFYFKQLGLSKERALLIDPTSIGIPDGLTLQDVFPDQRADLSLRFRKPANALERLQASVIRAVDSFCDDYETRIQDRGGIGFFLGGIGPDGHIGFNVRGSSHHSTTRLSALNYETEAAAATDLGGMEVTRGRCAITIGLATITANPDATVLIMASGQGKAGVIADAVEYDPGIETPASVIGRIPGGRFYTTHGAAVSLIERRLEDLLTAEHLSAEETERAVIDLCIARNRSLDELRKKDFDSDAAAREVLNRSAKRPEELAQLVRASLEQKLNEGLRRLEDRRILHTGPHHDDVMLGYMPYVMHLVRSASNSNEFLILTSGFTAVTNLFLKVMLETLKSLLLDPTFRADVPEIVGPDPESERTAEVFDYLDGIASHSGDVRARARSRRLLSNISILYEETGFDALVARVDELLAYIDSVYPGKKDRPDVQRLKGMIREWEEELVWGYAGINRRHVTHARLAFYTGDIFTPQPTHEEDVAPVTDILRNLKPNIISVALDPEGAGPDTHYKVLQVINAALKYYNQETGIEPEVWGYRNVWYRFHPAEANRFIPATLNTMAIMENAFMNCFSSQKKASFPSWEYDGPFCDLARHIWIEQFQTVARCLGERFFPENPHPRLRAAHGLVFLKTMGLNEFATKARDLKAVTEG